MYKLCISKKSRYIEIEIGFLLSLSCLKQIVFCGSFDEIKMHQMCQFTTIQNSKKLKRKQEIRKNEHFLPPNLN